MNEITTILTCLHPLIDTTTYRQLQIISQALLMMTGRITMLGISRWTEKGGSYRTIQRFFAKNIDWCLLQRLASKWRCKRMLGLGLYLSWKLLEAPVPGHALDPVMRDDKISGLAQEAFDGMFNEFINSRTVNISDRFSSYHIRVRDSFADRLRYALRMLFCPTEKEWMNFPVPAEFVFLHYVLRPCRLALEGLNVKR